MWACVGGGGEGGTGVWGCGGFDFRVPQKAASPFALLFTNRSENGWPCFRDFQTLIFNKTMLFFSLLIFRYIPFLLTYMSLCLGFQLGFYS